ncbi:MAG: RidA family protein [Planctomycetaceae bacterium]|nr:RidA family protein [Planctomycetaceae bacterium]
MPLVNQPRGDYRFLPGIAPYSCGVVASSGFEIVHVTLQRPIPYRSGFDRILRHLADEQRPRAALCAVELRSPKPFTFPGFAEFNGAYAAILERWGLFVDGVNPVARTNVAPATAPPTEPELYGFSYTQPCQPNLPPTFVVAGAGELPEGLLSADAIIAGGDISVSGIRVKARFVMDLMESRLVGLGGEWSQVTAVDIYTVHPLHDLLPEIVLGRIGPAGAHGVRWFYTRPPIEGIEYEMDLRGIRSELRLG